MSDWQPAIVVNPHNQKNYFVGEKIHVREARLECESYVGKGSGLSLREKYRLLGCDGRFFESKETFLNDGAEFNLVLCEHEILTD